MSIASLVYFGITAATAGFTGCAAVVQHIDERKDKWAWLALCAASSGACVFFIVAKSK